MVILSCNDAFRNWWATAGESGNSFHSHSLALAAVRAALCKHSTATFYTRRSSWAYFKADDSKALQDVPPSVSGGRLPCAKNSTKPSDYIMSNTSPPYHFLSSDPSAKSPKWKEGEPALSFLFWIAKAGEFFFVARKQKSESLAAEVGGWELTHVASVSTPPLIFLFVAVN